MFGITTFKPAAPNFLGFIMGLYYTMLLGSDLCDINFQQVNMTMFSLERDRLLPHKWCTQHFYS